MYDDEGYYVVLPDPDTLPEPYFAGLSHDEIFAEIDRLEREAWEQQMLEEMWYRENTWFRDYR